MKLQKLAGATSEIWQIFIRDSSSTTGGGLTGLTNASGSLTAYYHRDTDTTATAISLVTMTVGTFTSSGFKEIDATNMPGWYQFCPPNAALAAGAKSCAIHLKGAANMAPMPIEVQLIAVNIDDSVRMGMTALPNAAAGANGGLPLSVDAAGRVDVLKINGTSQTARDIGASVLLAADQAVNATKWAGGTIPAPNVTGVPLVDDKYLLGTIYSTPGTAGIQDINVINWKGSAAAAMTGDAYARLGAPAGASVSADVAAVKVDTAAVKTKTDFLPSATAGAAGGVFIAGTNAATTVTTSFTTTFTGNLTGSVGSVSGAVGSVAGAVGSVTGNVGGNVTGSVGSVAAGGITAASFAAGAIDSTAIAADAIGSSELAASAVTEIQTGLATAASIAALNNLSAAQVNAEADTALSDAGVTGVRMAHLDADVSSRASPTNITAGTITTVTNLTNAPASGDLTATMKASVTTAATAATPTAAAVTGLTVANLDVAVSTRLSAGAYTAPDNASIASIDGKATTILAGIVAIDDKTTNLPSDPADESVIIDATNAIMTRLGAPAGASLSADVATRSSQTSVDDLPTNAEMDTKLAAADDAVLAAIGALTIPTAAANAAALLAAAFENAETVQDFLRLSRAALYGKANGLAGTTVHYRDAADTKNRITATVDADGNRSAVTVDAS
ncbi:hypothetical protein [Mesorhizobium sp. M0129]|uniref:hypothetical protein n=1 Tax=Mesorhizobium sp. M0129 TaxID=2956886 RepID=UPI003336700E